MHIKVWSSNAFFSMVMFIGLQFFKYKGKILLIFSFWCIVIYGLNIIYLLCLEFYVLGSLNFFFLDWENREDREDSTSAIYYATPVLPRLCLEIYVHWSLVLLLDWKNGKFFSTWWTRKINDHCLGPAKRIGI